MPGIVKSKLDRDRGQRPRARIGGCGTRKSNTLLNLFRVGNELLSGLGHLSTATTLPASGYGAVLYDS